MQENRRIALRMLLCALQVDVGCVQAAEHIVKSGLISANETRDCLKACSSSAAPLSILTSDNNDLLHLFNFKGDHNQHRSYLESFYQ